MFFRFCIAIFIFSFASIQAQAQSTEPDAWWEICDSCITDSNFRQRALQVPGFYPLVYVTNRDANETRRFRRVISAEDRFDSRTILIEVFEELIPAVEKTVFSETVQGAKAAFVAVKRSDLAFAPSGRDSVIGDIQTGKLDVRVLNSLRTSLILRGHAGSGNQVSSGVTGTIRKVGINLNASSNNSIRTFPLQIQLTYANGSVVEVVLSTDFKTWSGLAITDDAGNSIPVEGIKSPAEDTPIRGAELNNRELEFSSSNPGFVENFVDALRSRPPGGALICNTEQIGPSRVRVTCTSTS
ncbi:MAG: hypothetical protein RQ741_12935 [Wenzhouxiangellaceae bacterium]|nr:hypothetical protein [Wenzhouxiangellaceae bacterium]